MEDGAYNMVFEVSPSVLENLMLVDALKIWVKNSWRVLANEFLLPRTIWSSLLKLICIASGKCNQSARRLICEPVAVYRPAWVCLPGDTSLVIGMICLTVHREQLHPDLTWRNRHGVTSSPTEDGHSNVVTNDQYGKWLI